MLAERMELGTPHGRDVMGVLLFQDLAVVRVPDRHSVARAIAAASSTTSLVFAAVKAAVALAVILFLGQRPMRAWFHLVARQRSLGALRAQRAAGDAGPRRCSPSWLGLSLALGAFLAGMLIAETEYRYQVEEDIKPFRDVLLGSSSSSWARRSTCRWSRQLGWSCCCSSCPCSASCSSSSAVARLFGAPLATSLRTGIYLAQAGELALVMLALATRSDVVPRELLQPVLAAMIISMCAAPLVIQFAEPLVRKLTANDWLARAAQVTQIAARSMARQDHIIVCGYGRSGQNLARLLEAEDIPYVAIESDPQRVREASADGSSVAYGDAEPARGAGQRRPCEGARSRHHVCEHADRAQDTAPRAPGAAGLPVIVRTVDDTEIEKLIEAGATEVVPGGPRGQPDARIARRCWCWACRSIAC